MQKSVKLIPCFKIFVQASVMIGVIFLMLHLTIDVKAETHPFSVKTADALSPDTAIANLIKTQLQTSYNGLYYPLSVERFYENNGFKLAFIAPDTVKSHSWDAMLFLDCVIQYGLNPADYHPEELQYDRLHALIAQGKTENLKEKVAFDLMLTDAMITLINNLHFGKLNPYHTAMSRDGGNIGGFAAEEVLKQALAEPGLMAAIEKIQPNSAEYNDLHDHMRLMTGTYILDCYDTPQAEIRLVAINMERLRWTNKVDKIAMIVNIPAYTLKFQTPNGIHVFRIIAGKPSSPTKIARTKCRSILKLAVTGGSVQEMIPLNNGSVIYLTKSKLFNEEIRALSDGHIVAEHGKLLVNMLLQNGGAGLKFRQAFWAGHESTTALINPIAVYIQYLTCAVQGGTLIKYQDVYHLDQQVEKALYDTGNHLALRY